MIQILGFRARCFAILLLTAFLAFGCSRKSGCPAEDAQVKVDKDGNYKPGKTHSGLLPPKAYKKSKKQ